MPKKSLPSTGQMSLGFEMSGTWEPTTSRSSISSAEGSHAPRSVAPTSQAESASKESIQGYGPNMRASFLSVGPHGWLSKTPPSGVAGCPMCGPNSPNTGMPPCRWSCAPSHSERPTTDRAASLLPTPTAKANHCAPYMKRWPAYARLQELCGTGGHPHPEVFDWMMGFPMGWTAVESPAMPLFPGSPSGSDGKS